MEEKVNSVMDVLQGLKNADVTPIVSNVVTTIEMLQGALKNVAEIAIGGCYDEGDKRQDAINKVMDILIEAQCEMCGVLGIEVQEELLSTINKSGI